MIESELLQEKYRVQKKLTEECKTVREYLKRSHLAAEEIAKSRSLILQCDRLIYAFCDRYSVRIACYYSQYRIISLEVPKIFYTHQNFPLNLLTFNAVSTRLAIILIYLKPRVAKTQLIALQSIFFARNYLTFNSVFLSFSELSE